MRWVASPQEFGTERDSRANAGAINPISKTNWEGVGVEPDIKVPASDALKVAQVEALKKLIAKANTDEKKKALEAALARVVK